MKTNMIDCALTANWSITTLENHSADILLTVSTRALAAGESAAF